MTWGADDRIPAPCLGCGKLVLRASYCPPCAVRLGRAPGGKSSHRRPGYTTEERKRRARVVRDWRELYGDWCPGYGRSGHQATDLTADHVVSARESGTETGDLQILCRSCNGRKAAR